MIFTKDSGLVKIFVRRIKAGKYKLEDVPEMDSLKTVIIEILERSDNHEF